MMLPASRIRVSLPQSVQNRLKQTHRKTCVLPTYYAVSACPCQASNQNWTDEQHLSHLSLFSAMLLSIHVAEPRSICIYTLQTAKQTNRQAGRQADTQTHTHTSRHTHTHTHLKITSLPPHALPTPLCHCVFVWNTTRGHTT